MNPQQVGRAGELYVAAEIHRRGGYAVTFAGNMPGIDILASDVGDGRRISIQVKARSSGTWHARVPRDAVAGGRDTEDSFWVFVDLGPEHPTYFIAPRWWIRNDIHDAHGAFLARHGGTRPNSAESEHHGIPSHRVEQWRDRWDVLRIF